MTEELRTLKKPDLPPGIYTEMPPGAWDCPRLSDVLMLCQGHSLAEVRWRMLHKSKQTKAALEGDMLHTMILSPDRWEDLAGEAPINPKTGSEFGHDTKAYAEATEAWKASHPGGFLVGVEQRERLEAIKSALYDDKSTRKLLKTLERREFWAVWEEPTTGLTMRFRMDAFSAGTLWDLKTCKSLIYSDLQQAVDDHGYDIQESLYLQALGDLEKAPDDFVFAFVRKSPPHGVTHVELPDNYLNVAYQEALAALSLMAKAYATDTWSPHPQRLTVEAKRYRKRYLTLPE